MIHKFLSLLFLLLLGTLVGVYFFAPMYLNLKDPFYDRFYEGIKLETRLNDRELEKIPKTIGQLSLSGATDTGIGIRIAKSCEFGDGKICSKNFTVEYKDYVGNYYSVHIMKFMNLKELKVAEDKMKSLSTNSDSGFLRFEQHEIGWTSLETNSFVLVQKGVCQTSNNQPETCSYPYTIEPKDIVINKYISLYPSN